MKQSFSNFCNNSEIYCLCLCPGTHPLNILFISYILLVAGRSQMSFFNVGYFNHMLPHVLKNYGWSLTVTKLARYIMFLEYISTFVVGHTLKQSIAMDLCNRLSFLESHAREKWSDVPCPAALQRTEPLYPQQNKSGVHLGSPA